MELAEKLERLPDRPGVYLYKDAKGQVVYVGKAASVRSRVRSYFQASRTRDAKTDALVDHIADVDYIVTANELEALILESNLVKRHRPRYNIILRDDKHYPFLKLTTNEEYPAPPRGPPRPEGRGDLLRPVLSGHGAPRDAPPRASPVPPPDLQHQDRRLGGAALPPVLHPPVPRALHRMGDTGGVRADGPGRRGVPGGPRRGSGPAADGGDGGGRRAGKVRAGRRPARPGPGAQHRPRAPEDHLRRAGGSGHPRPGAAGLRGVRPALLRPSRPPARPRGLLPRQAGQRDGRGASLGAAPPVLLEERHPASRDPPVDRGPRGGAPRASGWRSCATAA